MRATDTLSVRFLVLLMLFALMAGCSSSSEDTTDGDQGTVCDCPGEQSCDSLGNCIPDCIENTDCPSGQICEQETGLCIQSSIPIDGDLDADGDDPVFPTDGDLDTEGDDPWSNLETDLEYDLIYETDIEHSAQNPWIQVDPVAIDFGAVPVGSENARELLLMNIGGQTLEVRDLFLYVNSAEFSLEHDTLPISIEPTKDATVTVNYNPIDEVSDHNYLIVSSNDPATPNVRVQIFTAIKERAQIGVEPNPIDLGLQRLETASFDVQLENDGGAPLSITAVQLTGDSDPELSLAGVPLDLSPLAPIIVEAHEQYTIQLVLTPEEQESLSGTLEVHSDDLEEPQYFVPITVTICEPELEIDPEEYDFTGVHLGESETRSVTIENSGCYPLELTTIALGSATTEDFSVETRPDDGLVLQQNETTEIEVRYAPDGSEAADVGSIVLDTNDRDEEHVVIPFIAEPVPAQIEVTPDSLHFDALSEGASILKTLTIKNVSTGGLLILHRFELITEGTVFYKGTIPPDQLAPGGQFFYKIGYAPDDTLPDTGTLVIYSNDPDPEDAVLSIPLSGDGVSTNQCPIADAGEDQEVEPLARVQLDGTGSSDPDGTVEQYLWTVIDKPSDSRSIPIPMNIAQPNFFFDIAGTYTLQLRVWDNQGMESCEPATVTYTAVPGETIHIQLIWDTPNSDMDLHLVRPGGALWDGLAHGGSDYPVSYDDCFFSTCKQEYEPSGNPVDWSSCGHPSLDIDDQNGYGPENINLNDPCEGDYELYVHFWDAFDAGPTTAKVRIYVLGELRYQEEVLFTEEHKRWYVANIRWGFGDATIFEQGTMVVPDGHGN